MLTTVSMKAQQIMFMTYKFFWSPAICYNKQYCIEVYKESLKSIHQIYIIDVLIIYSTNTEYQSHILTATDRSAFDKKSFAQLQLSELNERDTGKKFIYHVDKHYFFRK